MDSGLITGRYAVVLLQYAQEQGQGESVMRDAQRLSALLPALEKYLHRLERAHEKEELLKKALPDMCEPFGGFLHLVLEHRREGYLKRMLQTYISSYRRQNGIAVGHLTVASQPTQTLLEALEKYTRDSCGASQVEFDIKVDPDIIGGYIYRVGDRRLDASVKRQLRELEKKFETKEKRIL